MDGHTEGDSIEDPANRLSELNSVVSYLRKEKQILDLQVEMSKRENGVLKSQIERLNQTLQETRASLAEVCLVYLSHNFPKFNTFVGTRASS